MRPDLTRRFRSLFPAFALGVMISMGCSEQSEIGPGTVITVRVDPETLILELGLQDTLKAFPIDQRGSFLPNETVNWSSSDEAVATVDAEGTVSGTGLGMATITAMADQVPGTSVVLVVPSPTIGATPATVQLQAFGQSGTNPMDAVVITGVGGSVLDELALGTIVYDPSASGWLNAVLDQANAPANIALTASVTGLALGTYTATVPVTEPDAINSPLNLSVVLNVVADVATTLASSAGTNQTAAVGTAVVTPPAVLVTDQFGNPVAGTAVTFAVATGGGSITGGNATTGPDGIATVGSWTLGTTTGSNTLTATSAGLTGSPATFTATAIAADAGTIALAAGSGQSATVNAAVATAPAVRITDQFGNTVSGTVVTWTSAAGNGTIDCGGGNTTTCSVNSAAVTGLSTLTSWTLGTTAGTNTITAAVTGLAGSPVTISATGIPGSVTTVAVNAGDNQSARPGAGVAISPSVLATDAFGNPVPSTSVTFTVINNPGPGLIVCAFIAVTSCSVNTNASGIATLPTWFLSTSGVPTAAQPSFGSYVNGLTVTSGTGTFNLTGFARWSFASDVAPIFTTNSRGSCNGCHSVGNFGVYTNIVNVAAVDNPGCGTLVVTTGSLANSFLYQKINHTPACGGNMPTAGAQLTQNERFIVRDWILNFAPNN